MKAPAAGLPAFLAKAFAMTLSFTGAAAASAKLPGGGGRVRRVAVSLCLWPAVQELRSNCQQQVLIQVREARYALSLRNKPCPVQPGVDDDLEFQLEQLCDGQGPLQTWLVHRFVSLRALMPSSG